MIMRKRFKSRKKVNSLKKVVYIIFLLVGFFLSYLFFYNKVRKSISEEDYLNYLLKVGFNHQVDRNYITSSLGINAVSNLDNPANVSEESKENSDKNIEKSALNENKPLIYIYNSHDTEEYLSSYFNVYNIKPDVKIAAYYLKEKLNDLGINAIVENQKIKDILNKNNWVYRYSYQASRVYLEEAKKNNPSLKYFIDLHRDSSKKETTTTSIAGKNYARVMFLVGLEHDNYEENLKVASSLNEMIKAKYPNLTRGIYKKSGPGVNGIYNQDFDSNCILIEVGGQYNSIIEVSNTIEVLAKVLYEYIGE